MNKKPITPKMHGIMDYALGAMQLMAPSVFKLNKAATALCYSFAGTNSALNSVTDHNVGLKPMVPFKTHGKMELPILASMAVLPMITGAAKQKKARWIFLAFLGIAATTALLTDFDAKES